MRNGDSVSERKTEASRKLASCMSGRVKDRDRTPGEKIWLVPVVVAGRAAISYILHVQAFCKARCAR